MQTERLNVTGMTCGGCISKVSQSLKAVAGVNDVDVSLATGEVNVQFDDRLATLEQLKSAVQRAGYGIGVANSDAKSVAEPQGKAGCCG